MAGHSGIFHEYAHAGNLPAGPGKSLENPGKARDIFQKKPSSLGQGRNLEGEITNRGQKTMKEHEYIINGKRFVVEILSFDGRNAEVRVNGTAYRVDVPQTVQPAQAAPPPLAPASSTPAPVERTAEPVKQKATPPPPKPMAPPPAKTQSGQADNQVVSPMPGIILNVLVEEGQAVQAGDPLLVLEAMKMENEIHAPRAGTIKKILAGKGTEVRAGTPLIEID